MIVTAALVREYVEADILSLIPGRSIVDSGWNDEGIFYVETDSNLTGQEVLAVQRRLSTASQNEEDLQARAVAAYQDLRAFENLATPTNAQTLAVVRLLCRVVRALIRAQYRQFDAVD